MIKEYQELLKKKGYDVGVVDGIMGKKTREAIKAFQKDNKLVVDGIIGKKTLELLTKDTPKKLEVVLPWIQEIVRRVGLHENKNNTQLSQWLKSEGVGVNPSRTPWCGDAVETALLRSLGDIEVPDNPLLAKNWTTFGTKLDKPLFGAIMVFWRESKQSHKGHVGFYVGEQGDYYRILGGNQSNAINVSLLRKNRLRENGIRWPKEFPVIDTHQTLGLGAKITENEE